MVHQRVQREQRAFTDNGAVRLGIAVGHPLLVTGSFKPSGLFPPALQK
ncbi:hypothetical protein ECBCE034MS14_1192 [Escherichia coli BCE034_MS-14]|nr:hypothetical protein ECBCE034MS14_1192 [Escherichia coli BCE034_MS-14]